GSAPTGQSSIAAIFSAIVISADYNGRTARRVQRCGPSQGSSMQRTHRLSFLRGHNGRLRGVYYRMGSPEHLTKNMSSAPRHKTRDLPLPLCYPLTPGPARVSCHGVPAGFVSPPLPPDIRQGGSASPHWTPAPEGVVHASAMAPPAEPGPPAHLLS